MAGARLAYWLWRGVSASFVVGALAHVYFVFVPDASPLWRHALFVVINLAAAWGCWQRPRWFVWAFSLLLFQQLFSHGRDFIQAWPARVDWRSLLVLVWMPTVAMALWRDRREQERLASQREKGDHAARG